MERNPPPTSDEFIRRSHNKLAQATADAEVQLGRLMSPQRSSWSPNPTERSTSTAYSHTATNSTARDLSSFTARSPMSLSPAVLPNGQTSLAKRSISPNKGPVLTEKTRSRPSIRRSEIVANKKNQNNSGNSVSPSTALTPGRIATTFVPKTPISQGKSQKSTKTAVGVTPTGRGTSGCRTATAICTPGSQKSMKSMKTGKETSANGNKSTKSVQNFETPLRLTNRSQKSASSKKTPTRPADASRSIKITPRSRSTATAFTPGGLSAVTARSISQNTPGKTARRNSSLASPTRTARELTAPATPKSGFNAEMSGYTTPGEEIDWERERIERTRNLEMGPPLRIIETTSFSRTPERTVVTALPGEHSSAHTARPVSKTTSAKSQKSQKPVYTKKISPGGFSARTVTPISERTRKKEGSQKKNPSGTTIQAVPPKGKSSIKGFDGNPSAKSQKSAKQKRTSAVQSKKSVSTAKSFKLPSTASTASEIDPEVLREARQNNGTGAMVTSTLPDGSLKVVLQLSVSAAGGRVALAGKAPQGMITTSVVVNGTNIYTAA